MIQHRSGCFNPSYQALLIRKTYTPCTSTAFATTPCPHTALESSSNGENARLRLADSLLPELLVPAPPAAGDVALCGAS